MLRKAPLALLVVALASLALSHLLETGLGSVTVERVSFPSGDHTLAGTLYAPSAFSGMIPGVVLSHGISNSREPMSGLALELAHSGFAALAIDLDGHGESGGALGGCDPSLGVLAALNFLRGRPWVDEEKLGLAGHSLGAGAARYAALKDGRVKAVIFIGGGVGGTSEAYGALNSTFPPNLLVAVGSHDVLFDKGLGESLERAFSVSDVEPDVTYGDLEVGTARRLVRPDTIHLLEPVNPAIVEESVGWLVGALGGSAAAGRLYLWREMALTAFFASFHVLVLYSFGPVIVGGASLGVKRWMGVVFGLAGLILFIPSMLLGALIPFPPLIFGSSMAWWLLLWGLSALMVRSLGKAGSHRVLIVRGFNWGDAKMGAFVAAAMYLSVSLVEAATGLQLRLLVPVFRSLTPARALLVPEFLPFFAAFFVSENAYFRGTRRLAELLLYKTGPFLGLLLVQYGAMFILGVRIVPGFAAFLVEFLWVIVPLLGLSSVYTWRLGGVGRPWTAVVLNALLFSWASAGLFPFGAL